MVATVAVVGSGVQGLYAALRLAEAGFAVRVVAAAGGLSPPNALWELPVFRMEPQDAAARWARESLDAFLGMHERFGEEAGVVFPVPCYAVSRERFAAAELNPFRAVLPRFRHGPEVLREAALARATGGLAERVYVDAQAFDSLVLDTRKHLMFLRRRIAALGGKFIRAELTSLERVRDLVPDAALVVNCSGIGARELVPDEAVFPIKGEVAHADLPNVCCAICDEQTGANVIPMPVEDGMAEVGGTGEMGVWDRAPTEAALSSILERAVPMLPDLGKIPRADLDRWSGLRPGRHGGVRFEPERRASGLLIFHCYGHGGGGIITAPGCASDVVAFAIAELGAAPPAAKL